MPLRHSLWPVAALALGFLGVFARPVATQTPARRPLSLDDLAQARSVTDPHVSPDGQWVAYVVGTADLEKDKRDSDIWMVSWDGTSNIRLTSTSETSESHPRWSPDGKYLRF
jgi:Tol biopolymer transport system component